MTPGSRELSTRFPSVIRWHRRLEARVVLYVSAIALCSLALLIFAAQRVLTAHSLRRSTTDLRDAKAAFDRLVTIRADNAAAQARLITELPVFRAHLTDTRLSSDPATIGLMADQYCRQLSATFCLVTDPAGRWLGSPGWPAGERPAQPEVSAAATRTGRSHRELILLDRRVFLVVAEPALFGDEVLGTFTAGYALNDEVARELARVTHTDVTIVAGRDLSGSSLDPATRGELGAFLRSTVVLDSDSSSPSFQQFGPHKYVAGRYALTNASRTSPISLMLLQDWSPTERAQADLENGLTGVGLLVFCVALGATLVFSRRVTRPLSDIANMARDIAAGNWGRRVPVRGTAEAAVMAEAFNDMSASLSRSQSEAHAQSERLQDEYNRFYAVTQSAVDAIVSADRHGRIIFLNRAAEAMFGYSRDEALALPLSALLFPRDAVTPTPQEALTQPPHSPYARSAPYAPNFAAESGGVADEDSAAGDASNAADTASTAAACAVVGGGSLTGRTLDMRGQCKDGTELPVEVSVATWRAGGEPCCTAFIRDVTRRTALETQLRQAQKMEAIGQLAGGIAHDFNNLLTIILGYCDLILDSTTDDSCRGDIEEIRDAGQRATAMTRQLLSFSRKQVLLPSVLDVNALVAGTKRMLGRLIGEDIRITSVLAAEQPWVTADPSQLDQIIFNLAVNARDAMPNGGTLTIETANLDAAAEMQAGGLPLAPGLWIVLSVTDSGCGMDGATQAHVFEPFFTTKEPGRGTGLGLATVYGIVQQSGGHILLNSQPGHGAQFRIFLPAVPAPADGEAVQAEEQHEAVAGTILLVEDEPQLRALAGTILRKHHYLVLEARDGEEALGIAATHADGIDLLLTDVVMPGISGFELASRLESLCPDARHLFMSGYSDKADQPRSDGQRVPFLQKPFTPAALVAKVRDVLARSTLALPQR